MIRQRTRIVWPVAFAYLLTFLVVFIACRSSGGPVWYSLVTGVFADAAVLAWVVGDR